MVKTLKITTISVAVSALAFTIFIAAKGIASDKNIENYLKAPGVAALMQAGSTGTKPVDAGQDTPLLKQAKAFALRINPPPPPPPVQQQQQPESVRPKVEVAAKFTLVGTSFYPDNETGSWALINEVGKGWHWVKQGEKVGHLTVESIGDGIVLIRDGSKTYELTAERKQKPDYVKSYTGLADSNETIAPWRITEKPAVQPVSQKQKPISSTENTQTAPPPAPKEVTKKEVQENENTQTTPPPEPKVTKEEVQENIEWVRQLQENPESLGMTAEEAKELEGLGEVLNFLETELKTVESNEPNTANEPNLINKPVPMVVKDPNEQRSPGTT